MLLSRRYLQIRRLHILDRVEATVPMVEVEAMEMVEMEAMEMVEVVGAVRTAEAMAAAETVEAAEMEETRGLLADLVVARAILGGLEAAPVVEAEAQTRDRALDHQGTPGAGAAEAVRD
jgi:hypothetical protein